MTMVRAPDCASTAPSRHCLREVSQNNIVWVFLSAESTPAHCQRLQLSLSSYFIEHTVTMRCLHTCHKAVRHHVERDSAEKWLISLRLQSLSDTPWFLTSVRRYYCHFVLHQVFILKGLNLTRLIIDAFFSPFFVFLIQEEGITVKGRSAVAMETSLRFVREGCVLQNRTPWTHLVPQVWSVMFTLTCVALYIHTFGALHACKSLNTFQKH